MRAASARVTTSIVACSLTPRRFLSRRYALWGVTGAILSIPLVASMRIVLTHIRHPYSLAVIRLLEGNLTLDDADGANSPWSSAPAAHSGVPAERSDDWAFGLQQV